MKPPVTRHRRGPGRGDPRRGVRLRGKPAAPAGLEPARWEASRRVPGGRAQALGQWILDTSSAAYDQRWLDYQHEIGLRHHRARKNQTDGAPSTPIAPFRDLFALVFPVTFILRPFLARGSHSTDVVDKMYAAWLKSCLLLVTLWSHPYIAAGDF